MARILFINSVCSGSTGTICKNLYKGAEKEGHTCCIAFGRGVTPDGFNTIKIGNTLEVYLHVLKARLFDGMGFGSKIATKKFIKQINDFKPDIIHIHNIHGYYINVEILFNYLKQHPEIKKVWTLHDCWAFTGHCAYYTYAKCNKWKKGCTGNCPNKKEYPKTLKKSVEFNFSKKKKTFLGVKNMVLVTPSVWLKNEMKQSFMSVYPVKTINNGINCSVFKHVDSDVTSKYCLENKKIILGVASVWDNRKGLNYFLKLSKILPNDYKIVLIGLKREQIKTLPKRIIGIERTENVEELVGWYSSAMIFINPTLEDNYPTTNLESLACGTPVLTFNTGGSPESAFADNSRIITDDVHDVLSVLDNFNDFVFKENITDKKMSESYLQKIYITGENYENTNNGC